jgi:hypothetical protein
VDANDGRLVNTREVVPRQNGSELKLRPNAGDDHAAELIEDGTEEFRRGGRGTSFDSVRDQRSSLIGTEPAARDMTRSLGKWRPDGVFADDNLPRQSPPANRRG